MPGSVFISHSGERDKLAVVAMALRRHGMRPWRDAEALPLGARTRDEIIRELDQCRAAIVWLSRATLTSDYVKTIELPTIFEQQERRGLDLIPVFVDYAPGEEANAAVREIAGREIGDHNGYKLDHDEPFEDEAERIARCYTSAALRHLAGSLPPTRPLLRCVTRTDAAPARDDAHVNLDWRIEYPSDGSLPDSDTVDRLQTALARVADETIAAYGAGEIDLALRCHLHLGIAVGHAFRRPSGMLPRLAVDDQEWAAAMLPTDAAPAMERRDGAAGPANSTRASVEVSLSQDVGPGVDKTVASTGIAYAARIKLVPSAGPAQTSLPDSTTANVWAQQTADTIAELRNRAGITDIDLYLAAPIQFAVMLGWRLNAVGTLHLHHWDGNVGPYRPVWTLPPT